jgi:hypothetical protein
MIHWAVFGVTQVIVVAYGWHLLFGRRRPQPNHWLVLTATGAFLLVLNAAWYASGGMSGPYAANMRGGMNGFWFSTATFVEVLLLGIAMRVRGR